MTRSSSDVSSAAGKLPPLGLVAGWGRFPLELAEHARASGREVVVAAIKAHADEALRPLARDMRYFGVAKLGAQLRFFEQHGVREVLLAGKLFKDRILFHGWGWIGHFPDLACWGALYHSFISGRADQRDDTLLRAIVGAFARRGMTVLASCDVAPQLMAEEGVLSQRAPTRREAADMAFGWQIAREMGRLDIGQSIIVRDQTVLGVEAIEGTDALIARMPAVCPRGGFKLVKLAKPQQNIRLDVPTIGLRTVEQLHRAGGTAIAIEAGKTIFVDREQTLRRANQLGIALVSLTSAEQLVAGRRRPIAA
ncbi:MAG: LpxI family protein [Aureliella sp.]